METIDVQISCINKTDRDSAHERISHIGGVNADGTRWKMTLGRAIEKLEDGTYRFWTAGGGTSVWVEVVTSAVARKYLKTIPDRVQPDNLLALPECP